MALTNCYCGLAELKADLGIGETYTAATLSFDNATKVIADTALGLEMFATGDKIIVSGSTSNDGTFTVATGATAAQIVTTEALTDEVAGDTVTITDITNKKDDPILEQKIEAASRGIDTATGRRFYGLTATKYIESDALEDDGLTLWVPDDLISITTLTNADSDATVIASTEYWLIDRNEGPPYYAIRLKSDSDDSWEWDTDGWVSVLGSWGWSATAPDDISQACIRWASWLYHLKDAPVYETTVFPESGAMVIPRGLPQDIVDAITPYRRIV